MDQGLEIWATSQLGHFGVQQHPWPWREGLEERRAGEEATRVSDGDHGEQANGRAARLRGIGRAACVRALEASMRSVGRACAGLKSRPRHSTYVLVSPRLFFADYICLDSSDLGALAGRPIWPAPLTGLNGTSASPVLQEQICATCFFL